RRGNAGMTTADNENLRLAIGEPDLGLPQREPVRPCEITRVGGQAVTLRPRLADQVEVRRCRDRPGLWRSTRRTHQPESADSRAIDRLEGNHGLDDIAPRD